MNALTNMPRTAARMKGGARVARWSPVQIHYRLAHAAARVLQQASPSQRHLVFSSTRRSTDATLVPRRWPVGAPHALAVGAIGASACAGCAAEVPQPSGAMWLKTFGSSPSGAHQALRCCTSSGHGGRAPARGSTHARATIPWTVPACMCRSSTPSAPKQARRPWCGQFGRPPRVTRGPPC